jgi:prepilin-type N-terminal cleavage/methylation domain-containing protein
MTKSRHFLRGFSLIELALGLLIVGLLLGGALPLLTHQIEQQRTKDTQQLLDESKEALLGFALVNGRLPCPDKTGAAGAGTANDGLEDFAAATGLCSSQDGNLPWATLGLPDVDAWGRHLRYSVTDAFSRHAPAALLTLAALGDRRVCQSANCAVVLANALPAVLLSHGKNGRGARSATGAALPAPLGADELENSDADRDFVSHALSAANGAGGEFDDSVSWLSAPILFNRMVQAGKLP